MHGPTVNMNGTDATTLFKERVAVVAALTAAREAIATQTIHGRDYQTGPMSNLFDDMRETTEDLRVLRALTAKYAAEVDKLEPFAYTGSAYDGNNRA